MQHRARASWLGFILLLPCSNLLAGWTPQKLLEFTNASCQGWQATDAPASGYTSAAIEASPIEHRDRQVGTRFRLSLDHQARIELDVIKRGLRPTRFVSSLYSRSAQPLVLVSLAADCSLQVARQIKYNAAGQALNIVTLDANLNPRGSIDWLNPSLEFIPRAGVTAQQGRPNMVALRVAMVDSGVNYLLPEINRRLARDPDGQLIGYDFWDLDGLPFDAHPAATEFFLQRHGTRSASVMLSEAPDIELVPYRYPRPDMTRMRALVAHAARHQVSIVGMPLGSNRIEDWRSFAQAARAHPHILFIASAGNNGRDIDRQPVYPAALDIDNLLVVTSADDFVRPAQGTNWGQVAVDFMLPAERLPALDFSGREIRVSGSSYAVSRATALAARLKQAHRQWGAADIIAEMKRRYGDVNSPARNWVSSGYIADPLAGASIKSKNLTQFELNLPTASSNFRLPLDVLVLDENWDQAKIRRSLQQAFGILAQCDINAGPVAVSMIDAPDYLRDLSTGGAHTLLAAIERNAATVVLARDTRMQEAYLGEAFGLGNTRMRPWLANSVWLMHEVEDAGIALAHELYHVLANNGAHVEGVANLMQGRTRPNAVTLTPQQCKLAQDVGVVNGLLLP